MSRSRGFSPRRLHAIARKEFLQMRRDRLTFGMMIGIPLLQVILFGFAINTDPHGLPTAVRVADHGPYGRAILEGLRTSGYFAYTRELESEAELERTLARGEALFAVTIPEGFTRGLVRGERPVLLVEADATDPAATSNAIEALRIIVDRAMAEELEGPLAHRGPRAGPVDLRVHARYNPEAITQYNIVPGLLGIVLTLTMILVTGLAITRESERGTMENLLSMPTRPIEVLAGKIAPYILVGAIQVTLILLAARFLFHVPMRGSLALLFAGTLVFIAANLAMGITFSTVARNQLQAMQLTFFFFLPSILLSGFMFPFRGMPKWAQTVGEVLPLTHYLRVVRGVLLKRNGIPEIAGEVWPIALFALVAMTVAVKRYRRTLD